MHEAAADANAAAIAAALSEAHEAGAAALRHDIERSVARNTELVNDNEALRVEVGTMAGRFGIPDHALPPQEAAVTEPISQEEFEPK